VVVPASDPKDLFVERVTMSTVQSIRLIWVGLVKQHAIFQFCRYSWQKDRM
jgi:hypothetical protein